MNASEMRVDRRTAIAWMAAVGAALGNSGPLFASGAQPISVGYGRDPKLIDAVTPWPRILTKAQRDAVAAICDYVLPAEGEAPSATAVGTHDLIDEWVSAPYPEQVADRRTILAGLDQLEARSRSMGAASFAAADAGVRDAVVGAIASESGDFYARVRNLTIRAYYTTEAGFADIGYIGNVALSEFPAPSPEVVAAIDKACAALGLAPTAAA